MPDLHLTITSFSGATPTAASAPAGAAPGDAPDAGAGTGQDAFAALLAGRIGKAAAAQAGLPAGDAKAPTGVRDPRGEVQDVRTQTGADAPALPVQTGARDAAKDAAKDGPAGDPKSAKPQSEPDPAMQLLVNLGLLPPPAPPAQTTPAPIAASGGKSLPPASADSRGAAASGIPDAAAAGGATQAAPGTASGEQADRRDAGDGRDDQRALHSFAAALQAQASGQKAASAASRDPGVTAPAAAPLPGASSPAGDAYASNALPGLQAAAPAAGAAAPVQVALPATLGTPAWREEFASGVTVLATHRITSAELRVQPAELGPVQVSIRMDGGEASISCAAQHAATRDALDAALPRLREMLEASGISVGNASVGPQFSGNGAAHSQPQAQSQAPAGTRPGVPADTLPAAPARAALRLDQLVDTFA